ncbi:multidrug resistance-associated protein 7 [Diachasma alloeum]|uniref:multidrug resistance-associated protein 7 n=1 Tax=Diachasma alloeum TaxID=454923 RepID=UPI0007384838|nr:multidrug resistance-associated protein 7 [Diachasma alloeum]XP_028982252.1 multidrug resistance-associated protein 7 [Diachasma alloeum]
MSDIELPGQERWAWNWTQLCGVRGSIRPLNPDTNDLGLCFQQLYLQIPTLGLLAIASAYYCGRRTTLAPYERFSHYALTLRLLITACLAILPIIRAYIILSDTTLPSPRNLTSPLSPLQRANPLLDSPEISNEETSAKPIDYLVAGTEGLAWMMHLCFVLSLRRGTRFSLRGPVVIRALIFMLIGISALLLSTHIKHSPSNDVLPNLSLGFSITVVALMCLYALTLLPTPNENPRQRGSRYTEIGENTALLNSPGHSYIHFLEDQDPNYLGTAMEGNPFLSRLLFHWVTPMMEKGVRGSLKHADDLYDLPEHVSTASINCEIDRFIRKPPRSSVYVDPDRDQTSPPSNNISLLRLLHRCFGWQFYAVGILKFIADCSGFVGPILLNKMVGFIEDKDKPLAYGYLYASLMFLATLIGAFAIAHFTFWMSIVGLKIRSTVVTLVYKKTLHSSNVRLNQEFTFGEIVNFMSTDSDRIVNSCPSFHTFWSIPLQLVVTLYLLYNQIGLSFLAGLAFAVILIPINKFIANKIGVLSTKMMGFKDQRVRLMGEILRGITTIKLNVWEEHFLREIATLREGEIKYLRGRKYLDALCVYFWATTPVLISILTFGTYVLAGNPLTAKTVFTSMALLNMLIGPLNAFPWVLNGLTEAWVSVKRIQRLLDLTDLDVSTYYSDPPIGYDIMLKNASFTANDAKEEGIREENSLENLDEILPMPSTSTAVLESTPSKKSVSFERDRVFSLRELTLQAKRGQLIGIMGKVGGGKSLFLDGILAEITKLNGIVAVSELDKGFAYVRQTPWLQRGTIRENILFGKAYDYNKYRSVLKACALDDDLVSLPKKDLTAVGEAGSTLSAGQKTRISLARAVYADKNIYLLDDILATLDTKVAKHIFQNVVLGMLKEKTRIVCTHQTQFLIHADCVVEMSKGRIVKQGLPTEILPDLEDYLLSSNSTEYSRESKSPKDLPNDESINLNEVDRDPMLDEEVVERGTVRLGVYGTYLNAVGRFLAICIFLAMILMQSSKNVSDLWLSFWVTHVNASISNSTVLPFTIKLEAALRRDTPGNYLAVYAILAVINTIFTFIRAFMFAYGGVHAAIVMHEHLLGIVLRAKKVFFDSQSIGRILNRFSSDTYTVDDSLPFISNILFAQVFALLGTVIITAYGLPWIFLVLAPLVPVYHWLQHHYRLTSRELKRLSSTSLSPLYTHFNETLQGLSVIRAFRVVPRFKHDNELFLEASQKAMFASVAAAQWLALRLQFIGVALLAGVCLLAVIQHQFDVADPGLIGLAITYALGVTGLLSGVVNVFTETEREMISVERIKQYFEDVPTEEICGDNPPYAWPSQSVVEFRNVVLRYRDYLMPSLNRVSFRTRPAEKIGVVGRTGAGKSSIFNCLFRLVEIDSGEILIDNVNVRGLQLNALRARLCIIPQNPFLFSGTVRENVDPLGQYPDMQIFQALEKCKLSSLVQRLGGLGASIDEAGGNLSTGQKQLFCLVRAILHNARILCIDEATANVDLETDKAIQNTIKSSFRSATVITIAHRIRTIMHCDRVLVMGDGQVLEFDEPNVLIEDEDSYFYALASQEFADQDN